MADIAKPSNNRVLCMAVTSNDNADNDGRPTSWSAAIDALTSGAAEEDVKRLFVVSAGTAQAAWFCAKLETEYPEMWSETVRALMIHSAELTDKMKEQFC